MNIINEFFVSFILIKLYFKFKVCRKIKFPLLWKFYFSKWKFYFSADSFATFISSLDNLTLGIAIAIAVAIHNIPEGLAVSLPIYHATGDKKKAFIYSALSGLAEPLGAFVGALILLPFIGDLTLAISFAVIAGIMVFISLDELLPAAKTYDKAHDSLYGLIAGMAIMALSLNLLGQ